jgi:phosphatidylglycerophosphatase A
LKRLAFWIATWFGCGYMPKAPGTAGAAAGVVIAWILHAYTGAPGVWMAYLAVLFTLPAVWASDVVANSVASQGGKKDPQIVVVDEVLGVWVTLAGATALNWKSWLLAFGLFRLFDIWKPQPVRWFERLPGGLGIVADDVMAGVYGALVLFAAGWFNLY